MSSGIKKLLFCLLLCSVLLVSFSSAWSETTFNNSLTTENLTYMGNDNYTRWLEIPEDTFVTSAYLNMSGYEFINYSNLYTPGSYSSSRLENTITRIIQGNMTIDNLTIDKMSMFMGRYSSPLISGNIFYRIRNSSNDNILAECDLGDANSTITSTIFAKYECDFTDTLIDNIVYLTIERNDTSSGSIEVVGDNYIDILGCSYTYNNATSSWSLFSCVNQWVMNLTFIETPLYPYNSILYINNTNSWNVGGKLNSSFSPNKTNNLYSGINNYISSATAISGNYFVPFIFNSDRASILEYLILQFNNDGFIENSQTYNSETTEGNIETFKINVSFDSDEYTLTPLLYYNGTSYVGTSFSSSNTREISSTIQLPSLTSDTNLTFYWNLALTNSTGTYYYNSSSHNQTVYNVDFDDCSVYTNTIFNFTIFDEELQTMLTTPTTKFNFNLYDSNHDNLIINYSDTSTSNPVTICLNINLTASSDYSMDALINYEKTGYAIEYYNIQKYVLNNNSALQNIKLYDLNSSDSTDFQLTFTGADYTPVENALVYVERQYVDENVFKVVELPKTDSNGQTLLHLVRSDVIYNFRIIKDGVILGAFTNIIAFCEDFSIGDCKITLNAFDSVETIFNYNTDMGIIYTGPVYNGTLNTISFSYSSSDGSDKTVDMNITRNDIFGNRSICDTTLTAASGTLICNIDPNIEESVLKSSVFVDGDLTISSKVDLDSTSYGDGGYLVMFVMIMSFVLIFSESKNMILISILVSFAGAIGLNLVSSDLVGLGASGVWLLVVIIVALYKLNKERVE